MSTGFRATKFPTELKDIKYEIEGHAHAYGLDFFKVIFEVLDYRDLNEVASYGGFPCRYPHWRFGMEYDRQSKSQTYGLSKIYEMVINNDPCYAYLLKGNNMVDQKLVMAHVYAHCDFFKNNAYFAHTNRKMVDEMANHATRIRRYVERYGMDQVEAFIDCCLSVENLIDPHWPVIKRNQKEKEGEKAGILRVARSSMPDCDCGQGEKTPAGVSPCPGSHGDRGCSSCQGGKTAESESLSEEEHELIQPRRLQSKGYMDAYINPPEFLKARVEKLKAEQREKERFPENPEADVLLFLVEHAPLKNWQRDILSIIREEAYYFLPQGQTKIMNEGWASYWHSRIMTEKVLKGVEIIDYADHHSATMGGSRLHLNPYKLGMELFRDIEERWNKGRFGKEYDECDDAALREKWDLGLSLGRTKIFEARRIYNDLTFLDTFLTEDFCRRHKFFVYAKEGENSEWTIKTRELAQIKELILKGLTNLGHPIIRALDGNFENRGELLLAQQHEGMGLQWDLAKDTLVNLHRLWKRAVHIETKKEGQRTRLSFNGKEIQTTDLQ
jgi:stage V sporulation protein R